MDLEQQERRLKLEEYKRNKLKEKESILKESGIENKPAARKVEPKKAAGQKSTARTVIKPKAVVNKAANPVVAPSKVSKPVKPASIKGFSISRSSTAKSEKPLIAKTTRVPAARTVDEAKKAARKPIPKPIKQRSKVSESSLKNEITADTIENISTTSEIKPELEHEMTSEKENQRVNPVLEKQDFKPIVKVQSVESVSLGSAEVNKALPKLVGEQKKSRISFSTETNSPLKARIQRLNTPKYDRTRIYNLDQSVKKLEEHFKEIKLESKPEVKVEEPPAPEINHITPQTSAPIPPSAGNLIFDTYSPADSFDSENVFEDSPLLHAGKSLKNTWDFNDSPILDKRAADQVFKTPGSQKTLDIFNEVSAPTPGFNENMFEESCNPSQTPSKNYEMSFSGHVPDMDISVMDDEGEFNLPDFEEDDYPGVGGLLQENTLLKNDTPESDIAGGPDVLEEPTHREQAWNLSDAIRQAQQNDQATARLIFDELLVNPSPDVYIEYARYEEMWQNYSKVADLFFQAADYFNSARELEIIDEAYRGFEMRLGQEYLFYNDNGISDLSIEEIQQSKLPDNVLKDLDIESFNNEKLPNEFKVLKKDRKEAVNEIVNLLGELKISKPVKLAPVFPSLPKPEKKVKIGVPVRQDEANITILTPMKVKPKLQKEYGTDTVITPARRSRRLFDEGEYHCSTNPDEEGASTKEKVQTLLSENGYAYAPNKVVCINQEY
ncbi:hypothetical protein HDV01_006001 [Terramyces sp. JEL0728]|nr:hypothetical protein HDV01_006001 [Terramyces sp. JEL0728]